MNVVAHKLFRKWGHDILGANLGQWHISSTSLQCRSVGVASLVRSSKLVTRSPVDRADKWGSGEVGLCNILEFFDRIKGCSCRFRINDFFPPAAVLFNSQNCYSISIVSHLINWNLAAKIGTPVSSELSNTYNWMKQLVCRLNAWN